jgi:hypothetical protein
MSKLLTADTPQVFSGCKPSKTNPAGLTSLCLIPLPPFLVPCMAANTHSSFTELGAAVAAELSESALTDEGGKKIAATAHAARVLQFLWWASRETDVTDDYGSR